MFFFRQKSAYAMRICDWSSDGCSSDLGGDRTDAVALRHGRHAVAPARGPGDGHVGQQAAMLVRQFGVGAVLIDVGRGLVAGGQQRDGGERRNDGERRTFHRGPPVRRLEKLAKTIHVATPASTVTITDSNTPVGMNAHASSERGRAAKNQPIPVTYSTNRYTCQTRAMKNSR